MYFQVGGLSPLRGPAASETLARESLSEVSSSFKLRQDFMIARFQDQRLNLVIMKSCSMILLILTLFAHPAVSQEHRVVIQVGTMLDGRGHVLTNTRIVIEGSKIVRIDPKAAPVDYDLRKFTVMPG